MTFNEDRGSGAPTALHEFPPAWWTVLHAMHGAPKGFQPSPPGPKFQAGHARSCGQLDPSNRLAAAIPWTQRVAQRARLSDVIAKRAAHRSCARVMTEERAAVLAVDDDDGANVGFRTATIQAPAAASSHRLQDRDGVVRNDRVVGRNRNLRLSRINEDGADLERLA